MADIDLILRNGNAEMARRLLSEFGIGLGKTLGVAEDGFRAEWAPGKGGVAFITLIARTDRAQVERIVYGDDS